MGFRHRKTRRRCNGWCCNFFYTNGLTAVITMKVCVVILMRTLAAIVVLAEGVLLFVGTVHCLVDEALLFKSAQSAVQRDAVYLPQFLFQIIVRQSFRTRHKQVQYLHPHVGEAQLV